jgi:uncharacterized membrane protein YfcA
VIALPELSGAAWALLGFAALTIGLSKTALPGANTIAVTIFAAVLPARESTGTILPLLLAADVLAVWSYRRDADWRALARLAPSVVLGLVVGAGYLLIADDASVRKVIGIILLALIGVTLWQRASGKNPAGSGNGLLARVGYGGLSGFTTMVANSGGPAMSLYLIAANFQVRAFLGTAAWFFFAVNLAKLPFSIGIGLLTVPGLLLDAVLVPMVLAGGLFGRWVAHRISQRVFEWAVIVITMLGAVYLILV